MGINLNRTQNHKYQIDYENFIDEGGFGKVFYTKDNKYAIKILKINGVCQDFIKEYQKEVQCMTLFNSPFITKLQDHFIQNQKYYIVMQKCDCDLNFLWIKKLSKLDVQTLQSFTTLIISHLLIALFQFYNSNVIHRDIKTKNILVKIRDKKTYLMEAKQKDLIFKMADFGISRILQEGQEPNTDVGTVNYKAPEIMMNQSYGKQVDIWSLGIVIFRIFFNYVPFSNLQSYNLCRKKFDFKKLLEMIQKKEKKIGKLMLKYQGISQSMKNIIRSMLVIDPNHRITIFELVTHDHFDKYLHLDYYAQFKDLRNKIFQNSFTAKIQTIFIYHFQKIQNSKVSIALNNVKEEFQNNIIQYKYSNVFKKDLYKIIGWFNWKFTQFTFLHQVFEILNLKQQDLKKQIIIKFKYITYKFFVFVYNQMLEDIKVPSLIQSMFNIQNVYQQIFNTNQYLQLTLFIEKKLRKCQKLLEIQKNNLIWLNMEILQPQTIQEISFNYKTIVNKLIQNVDEKLNQNLSYNTKNIYKKIKILLGICFRFQKILIEKNLIKIFDRISIVGLIRWIFDCDQSHLNLLIRRIFFYQDE